MWELPWSGKICTLSGAGRNASPPEHPARTRGMVNPPCRLAAFHSQIRHARGQPLLYRGQSQKLQMLLGPTNAGWSCLLLSGRTGRHLAWTTLACAARAHRRHSSLRLNTLTKLLPDRHGRIVSRRDRGQLRCTRCPSSATSMRVELAKGPDLESWPWGGQGLPRRAYDPARLGDRPYVAGIAEASPCSCGSVRGVSQGSLSC